MMQLWHVCFQIVHIPHSKRVQKLGTPMQQRQRVRTAAGQVGQDIVQ